LTASQASAAIRDGQLTSVELVSSCLSRIRELESRIQAWVTVDDEGALEQATRLDIEMEAGTTKGALHGVPVGIKDLYCTAGLKTTAGSPILADFVPDHDAAVVANLRRAGAVVLGKTVTTEWAASDAPPTRNPWNLAHTPGGSSSGSGAAVASRMCPGATGTQAAGSVVRPAAYNGVVGLKPTYGLLDRTGLMSHCWSVDHPGILVRTVEDAAIFLEAMVGQRPESDTEKIRTVPRYSDGLGRLDEAPRIGFMRQFYMEAASKELAAHVESTVQLLASAGAEIIDVTFPGDPELVLAAHWTIMKVEFAAAQEGLFAEKSEMYSPHVRGLIEVGQLIPGSAYVQALRVRNRFRRSASAAADRVDALLAPAAEAAPEILGGNALAPKAVPQTGDHSFQMPWSFSGLPALSLPSGLNSQGLPLAIQLIGAPLSEDLLLQTAAWCERALGVSLQPPVEDLIAKGR